jgi:hypothetical protein
MLSNKCWLIQKLMHNNQILIDLDTNFASVDYSSELGFLLD